MIEWLFEPTQNYYARENIEFRIMHFIHDGNVEDTFAEENVLVIFYTVAHEIYLKQLGNNVWHTVLK